MSIEDPIFGIDVHPEYQKGLDFERAKAQGYEYAFIKASEGPYRDGTVNIPSGFKDFVNRAKASGMITGYYHFLVQSNSSDHVGSGRVQADLFLRTIEDVGGIDDRLLCVDFEAYNPPHAYLTPSNATLESFIESLRKRVGDHPIVLYAGRGFWNGGTPSGAFDQYGADVAWDAMYRDMDLHVDPKVYYQEIRAHGWGEPWGGVTPMFWQFTSAGRVARMHIDVNAYRGTREQLEALTKGQILPDVDDGTNGDDDGATDGDSPPSGVPTSISPAMGDRQGWAEKAEQAVTLIEETFPVVCSTYNNHGTTGRSKGIDIWIAPFHNRANKPQEAFGDKIQKWIEANHDRLGWHYIIWWNWMRYHNGNWFDYTPWSRPASLGGWQFGDPDQNTRRHEDHIHLQIL
jgi:GH25 family lysozyme M1 (1,4-beta-N-acetylmuramidase)